MGNFDGLSEEGIKHRLVVDANPMDLNYETSVSPKNRIQQLEGIREIQGLLGDIANIMTKQGISPCHAFLGSWGELEKPTK